MLSRLHVENIALIDSLDLSLSDGFIVLTGETGAGKSIIIDAVNLVLGERADRELVKAGCEKALVEAIFEIDSKFFPEFQKKCAKIDVEIEDEQLVLSRELSISGRNVCRINGRLANLTMLKAVSEHLIDIHGQHEHQRLLNVETHIEFLDAFAKSAVRTTKDAILPLYSKWRKLIRLLQREIGSEEQRTKKMESLQHQINEIESAQLGHDEEEQLLQERKLLSEVEKIQSALSLALASLQNDDEQSDAVTLLRSASHEMTAIAKISPSFESIQTRLDEAYYSLADIVFELSHLRDEAVFDPFRHEWIEKRLDIIAVLKQKYGDSTEKILAFSAQAQKDLDEVHALHALATKGEEQKEALAKELYHLCMTLHKNRKIQAELLEERLHEILRELGMEKARIQIAFQPFPEFDVNMSFYENGLDKIEILISTNPGQPLKPLQKIASGGEMSRIMLALKSVVADAEENGITLIFDEIDTGISGRISAVVGEKMWRISRNHQVICVTHAAQIAALADTHYRITKNQLAEKTTTEVQMLNEKQHIEEIARIASGTQHNEQTIAYAQALVLHAHEYKEEVAKIYQ